MSLGGNIQFEDCSIALQKIIKSTQGAIGFLKNTVPLTTESDKVVIDLAFNKNIDLLFVYQNSTYIESSKDYNISADSGYIQNINGIWKGSPKSPIVFNFVVFKAIPLDGMRIDGGLLYDRTISFTKLDATFLTHMIEEIEKDYTIKGTAIEDQSIDKAKIGGTLLIDINNLENHLKYINPGHIPYGGDCIITAANTYTVDISPTPLSYFDGMPLSFKIKNDSTGAATININKLGARSIVKSNGIAVSNLKANGIYTVRYNSSTTNFILQGEGGSGDALASDLLLGKKASTDAGDVIGNMPNNGAVNITAGRNEILIPKGYHNGLGKVVSDPKYVDQLQTSEVYFRNPWMYIANSIPVTGTTILSYGIFSDIFKSFIYNNKIYVITNDSTDGCIHVFDIATNQWSTTAIIESWKNPSYPTYYNKPSCSLDYHYANCIYNGIIYFVYNGYIKTLDLNTLISGSLDIDGHYTQRYLIRDGANCCVYNGIIYILGGSNREDDPGRLNDAGPFFYIYNITTKIITRGPDMPSIGSLVGCFTYNGKVYRLGGTVNGGGGHSWSHMFTVLEIYDIASNTWSVGASMPDRRVCMGCVPYNGKIYVFGGEGGFEGHSDGVHPNTWIYDIASNSWSISVDMSISQQYVDSFAAYNKIFVISQNKSVSVFVP